MNHDGREVGDEKTVPSSSTQCHLVSGNRDFPLYKKTSGRNNLKDVKVICGFLDDKIEEMDFAAFKSAFYRARQRLKKVKLCDTK